MSNASNQQETLVQLKRALAAIKELRAKLEAVEQSRHEPVAVIGMGCRLPGGIDSPAAFWQLLRNGVDAIGEVPAARWAAGALYDTDVAAPGKMNTRWGGFVEPVDQFDAAFFGISPREAMHMDPQQRLLLEVAYEAIENAGQTLERLAGSQTGVFIGIHSHSSDYAWMQMDDLRHIAPETATGTAHSIVANRLSYLFDLHGPSLAVDTACSSALVAVHLACQSLRNQECDMAFSGGVNLMLSPEATVAFSKLQMMAKDGHCKTFDADADGFVRGEGCGLVLLKRFSDAQRDGDPILALIRGSAVNQDGRTNGMTAPNSQSQEAVIRQALRNSHLEPAQITFVETHGTGTALGDPIEVEALANTLGRAGDEPCYLGSVKANVGHLEGAAGIAGLLKVILALQHGLIPPQLHFQRLNPHINLVSTRFVIPTQAQPWPAQAALRHAAISSFGFGGTNGHLVVSAAPDQEEPAPDALPVAAHDAQAAQSLLLPISARSPEALRDLARRYQAFLAESKLSLPDICYAASVHRSHLEHRLALVGATRQEFAAQLETFVQTGTPRAAVAHEQRHGIVFVFSGQGSQWAGMGRELLVTEPAFHALIAQMDALLFREGATWSLLQELAASPEQSRLDETEVAQPAIFALQVALAALWRAWGITPDAVVGHSVGEVAAAYVAGVLTLPEAVRLVFHRGRLMQRATGLGKMAAIGLSQAKTEALLQDHAGCVSVAAVNSPISTVIAGDAEVLAEIVGVVQEQGFFGRMLAVNYAFHTPQMEPFQRELSQLVAGLQPKAAMIPIYSTVTGRTGERGDFDAAYWGRNVREPVQFMSAVLAARADGYDAFLEVGPHPVLNVPMSQCMSASSDGVSESALSEAPLICASLQRDQGERTALLQSLAALYGWGYPVAWQALYRGPRRAVQLPSYPWQHKSYWLPRRERGQARPQSPLAQPVPREESSPSFADSQAWLYDVVWQPQAAQAAPAPLHAPRRWLVLADAAGLGSAIATQLETLGQVCTLIHPGSTRPEEFLQLFEQELLQEGPPLRGVLHLWSLDATAQFAALAGSPAESREGLENALESSQKLACATAVSLLQALAQAMQKADRALDPGDLPKLWLLTQGAQAVGSPAQAETLTAQSLVQAPLWGLGRVISLEHPELWGGLIDLDEESVPAASWVIQEITAPGDEDQVAYRQGQRYVARLVRSASAAEGEPSAHVNPDGLYLVTGGLGGLGLHVADWLVAQGAQHLVLTSRTGLPERSVWPRADLDANMKARIAAVRGLEARGAVVDVVAADVANGGQMRALFAWLGQQARPLRGIVHAAGTVSMHPLQELDEQELQAILRPKVVGGWLLHKLSQTQPLDFFVLFSSGAAIWGSAGMGHYAAANHFLDALAHYRHASGLPALSINWGWWREGGMATAEIEQSFTAIGVQPMPTTETLALLGQLLGEGVVQKIVAAVDWQLFKPVYEAKRRRPLLAQIADQRETAAQSQTSPLLERLMEAAPVERWEMLLAHVCAETATVLGHEDASALNLHQGFFKMGMNSLMTVQLRSRLEISLNCSLPATLAFEYPTIQSLTSFLAGELARKGITTNGNGVHMPPEPSDSAEAAHAADLDALASEDLLALFDDELAAANALVERNAE
ncbi:MAG: type I polyketide synthase [Caldilineaceae bacterium]|nr:type I polyketide synthase [Caldilineaceae bacterium]